VAHCELGMETVEGNSLRGMVGLHEAGFIEVMGVSRSELIEEVMKIAVAMPYYNCITNLIAGRWITVVRRRCVTWIIFSVLFCLKSNTRTS